MVFSVFEQNTAFKADERITKPYGSAAATGIGVKLHFLRSPEP